LVLFYTGSVKCSVRIRPEGQNKRRNLFRLRLNLKYGAEGGICLELFILLGFLPL
jgi:hypothetical protein